MTNLTEGELSGALKQSVPEPDATAHHAARARAHARRLRTRRRVAVSAVAVVGALVAGVPTLVTMTRDGGRTADPAGTPTAGGSTAFAPCAGNACDPATVIAAIRRPLNLPTVSPGEVCPVSDEQQLRNGEGFNGPFPALGAGPVYLTAKQRVGFQKPTTDRSGGPHSPAARGWGWQKVGWAIDSDYTGPVLLRGAQIDGDHGLRFDHYLGAVGYPGSGPGDADAHRELAYLGSGETPRGATITTHPSGLWLKAPGCYAIQADGNGFSETIVFRAVWD